MQRTSWLPPSVWDSLTDDVREFLVREQTGARAVARTLIDRILKVRAGQLLEAMVGTVQVEHLGAVFKELPDDRGHFEVPYVPHVLRGLGTYHRTMRWKS